LDGRIQSTAEAENVFESDNRLKPLSRKSIFDPVQYSPPDNASVAERIQCRRRHRLKFVATKCDGVVPTTGEPAELEQALTAKLTRRLADLKFHQDERSLRKVVDEVRRSEMRLTPIWWRERHGRTSSRTRHALPSSAPA
jgi:hypothetical protein